MHRRRPRRTRGVGAQHEDDELGRRARAFLHRRRRARLRRVRYEVVTLFPELFERFVETSFVGRAVEKGIASFRFATPRAFGLGNHKSVDDTPYGGGSGMVMRGDCLVQTFEELD